MRILLLAVYAWETRVRILLLAVHAVDAVQMCERRQQLRGTSEVASEVAMSRDTFRHSVSPGPTRSTRAM